MRVKRNEGGRREYQREYQRKLRESRRQGGIGDLKISFNTIEELEEEYEYLPFGLYEYIEVFDTKTGRIANKSDYFPEVVEEVKEYLKQIKVENEQLKKEEKVNRTKASLLTEIEILKDKRSYWKSEHFELLEENEQLKAENEKLKRED